MKKQKKRTAEAVLFIMWLQGLSLLDGTHRADAGASTAVDACVRVNLVDVAGGDGANGAFINAGAASSAVFSDFVSHFIKV